MGSQLTVILRANIALESDADLARQEGLALAGAPPGMCRGLTRAELVDAGFDAIGCRAIPLRPDGVAALRIEGATAGAAGRIVLRSAFAQEVFSAGADGMPAVLGSAWGSGKCGIGLHASLEVLDALLKDILSAADRDSFIGSVVGYLAGSNSLPPQLAKRVDAALVRRNTLHLAHNLHVYKAKFFPRFVAALLNIYGPSGRGVIVDPFVGSGTALFEAAVRGVDSAGYDIDPISTLISQNKVTPFTDPAGLERVVASVLIELGMQQMSAEAIPEQRLPDEIRRRLAGRAAADGTDWVAEIEEDAARIKAVITGAPASHRGILETLLSDALTKKVRYRFVGVGNGRYTFAVTKERVIDRFRKKVRELPAVASTISWVDRNVQSLGVAHADVADARELPLGEGVADAIVTSPPYLPASSGREHYALARAIPLAVLDVGSRSERDALITRALGGVAGCDCPIDPIMHAPTSHLPECYIAQMGHSGMDWLPPRAVELLEFLREDPQRRLKYPPTLEYLQALRDVLSDGLRILKPGAPYVIVLPRESVFYDSATKQHLFVCRTADMIRDIGVALGFDYDTTIDLELLKLGTPNARPRSNDAYFESAVVLRAPAEIAIRRSRAKHATDSLVHA